MFCLICFVPRLIVTLLGKAELLTDNSPIEYCDLVMAAFIISSLVSRTRLSVAPAKEIPETEGEEESSVVSD